MNPEMRRGTELSPNPETEKAAERLENAGRVFDDIFRVQSGEKVLFVTDGDPQATDRGLIKTLQESLDQRGIDFKEVVADEETTTAAAIGLLDEYKVVWTSTKWDGTGIDFYEFVEAVEEKEARMAECAGVDAEVLNNDGALAEDPEALEHRLGRMGERLKEVKGLQVKTSYGTDLRIGFRPGLRKWEKDTDKEGITPGYWYNLPWGEVYTTPDETRVEGVLVLPVLQDDISAEQGVDEFVRLTIKGGKITNIDGGESAEKLRRYLEEKSQDEDNPWSVAQISEVAFGANSKARSKVRDPEGLWSGRGVTVTEAEKRLGTMHIAVGSSQHGEEGTEGYNESDVHMDFVIPRSGLTVTAFKDRQDFEKDKNGERLIDEGRWNFLE